MILQPTIHRMDRRSSWKNYMLPGIYHVTVKAAEHVRSPFGKVVGSIDKPDGDPDAPRVALSPVGQMVEQEMLHSITAHYPMIEVQDHIIMPEHLHFILVVKRKIVNSLGRPTHLGQVIAGFKLGCNHRWWKMTGQQMMRPEEEMAKGSPAAEPLGAGAGLQGVAAEPLGTGAGLQGAAAEPLGTGAGRLRRQGPHHIATLPSIFQEGYCDVMPIDAAQLEQQRAYIKGNPRSRLMRTSNREWLQPRRGGVNTALTIPALRGYLQRECARAQFSAEAFAQIEGRLLKEKATGGEIPGGGTAGREDRTAGREDRTAGREDRTAGRGIGNAGREVGTWITCDTYGDRKLLERRLLPVVCHRKDAKRFGEQKQRCLTEATRGAVLVSPRIAKGEQAIIDEAMQRGNPVVLIADNGFPEIFHPSIERIERCAEGKLLIATPWEYHYRLKDEGITVMECKTMNCVAQALCRLSDDWWKKPDSGRGEPSGGTAGHESGSAKREGSETGLRI